MSNLIARLQKLENAGPQSMAFVWCNAGETKDAALARLKAEGKAAPKADSVYFISWGR